LDAAIWARWFGDEHPETSASTVYRRVVSALEIIAAIVFVSIVTARFF